MDYTDQTYDDVCSEFESFLPVAKFKREVEARDMEADEDKADKRELLNTYKRVKKSSNRPSSREFKKPPPPPATPVPASSWRSWKYWGSTESASTAVTLSTATTKIKQMPTTATTTTALRNTMKTAPLKTATTHAPSMTTTTMTSAAEIVIVRRSSLSRKNESSCPPDTSDLDEVCYQLYLTVSLSLRLSFSRNVVTIFH